MAAGGKADPSAAGPERQVRYRWAAQLTAGQRVLDAACGGGWGTAMLAESASEAIGVDLSPAAIADARQAFGEKAEFREGDLRSLPFADGEFECAVCFEAIAHVAGPEQALDELRRVVRSGGTLLISAPNGDAYPAGNPLHLSTMSSGELQSLLRERFARVAVHRQQTYFASLLCGEGMLARQGGEEISAETIKLAGGPPGSELYAVAVATDGDLPPEPSWLALGEDVDYAEQRRLLAEWQERAVQAEAKALALERELRLRQG